MTCHSCAEAVEAYRAYPQRWVTGAPIPAPRRSRWPEFVVAYTTLVNSVAILLLELHR